MEVLNKTNREYLAQFIPEDTGDWKKMWKEGFEIGKNLVRMETPFHKKYNVRNDADLRMRNAREGRISWKSNAGLATYEDQIAALKELDRWSEETGFDIPFCHQLPKTLQVFRWTKEMESLQERGLTLIHWRIMSALQQHPQ